MGECESRRFLQAIVLNTKDRRHVGVHLAHPGLGSAVQRAEVVPMANGASAAPIVQITTGASWLVATRKPWLWASGSPGVTERVPWSQNTVPARFAMITE